MRIEQGRAVEIILPLAYEESAADGAYQAGDEVPIAQRFTPEFVQTLVDISDLSPRPVVGMAYDGATFSEYVPPPPSAEEVLSTNTAMRDAMLAQAALSIAPRQDAVDLGEATDEDASLLKQWKQYRVALNRLDLMATTVSWPKQPG
jgi:hypothetical protein